MKMLNALIFSFIILNLVKKGTLDFHVTTATDTCMKEVIQALILTIIVLNLVSKGLFFTMLYYHRPLDIVWSSTI